MNQMEYLELLKQEQENLIKEKEAVEKEVLELMMKYSLDIKHLESQIKSNSHSILAIEQDIELNGKLREEFKREDIINLGAYWRRIMDIKEEFRPEVSD